MEDRKNKLYLTTTYSTKDDMEELHLLYFYEDGERCIRKHYNIPKGSIKVNDKLQKGLNDLINTCIKWK